jgi:putative transposase
LLGQPKWTYFYLYVILGIFRRYVVGWMIANGESAQLAQRLIADTCHKQGIVPGQLTIHADRGIAITSKPVAYLLADLGVTKTHSRPHVSDDNPYSESQCKTLKYRPEFPDRFGSLQDARAFCPPFFRWYNDEHHRSGIALLTPNRLHSGRAQAVLQQRQEVLHQAYARNPERFVRACPQPQPPPTAAWINPPGPCPLARGTDRNQSSDDRPLHALKIPARHSGIYAFTENIASPFHAEPRPPVPQPASEESRH